MHRDARKHRIAETMGCPLLRIKSITATEINVFIDAFLRAIKVPDLQVIWTFDAVDACAEEH